MRDLRLSALQMVCLRFDLDYVPWDTANAEQYGHGEPAMVLKILELARRTGAKFHFFVSNRSLRTFPTLADAVLGEGHDLDWLTHHPDDPDLYEEAKKLFALAGHRIEGVATTAPWPMGLSPDWLRGFKFVTAPAGPAPPNAVFFPQSDSFEDESLPFQIGGLHEIDFEALRQGDELAQVVTLSARPQVLAKRDPQLQRLSTLLRGRIQLRTLRQAVAEQRSKDSEP